MHQGQYSSVEIVAVAYDSHSLHDELLPDVRAGNYGAGEDEALEWAEIEALVEADEVEVPEDLAFAAVDPIPETVSQERIPRQPLSLVHEQSERQLAARVVRARHLRPRQPRLRVHDQPPYKVQVRLDPMLLAQLQGYIMLAAIPEPNTSQRTERISAWLCAKFSSVRVESRKTIWARTIVWMLFGGVSITLERRAAVTSPLLFCQ